MTGVFIRREKFGPRDTDTEKEHHMVIEERLE